MNIKTERLFSIELVFMLLISITVIDSNMFNKHQLLNEFDDAIQEDRFHLFSYAPIN